MKMKKSLSVLTLVFCFMLQMAVPVMAAHTTGSLTVDGAKEGEEFRVFQVFTGTPKASGTSYVVHADFIAYFVEAINAAALEAAQAVDPTANPDPVWTAGTAASSPADFGIAAQAYAVSRENDAKAFALELAEVAETKSVLVTITADADGVATTASDISLGYYLVLGDGNAAPDYDYPPMLGVIEYADPGAGFAVQNFKATVKAGMLEMTKEILHNETNVWGNVGDNQIGDDVEFRITSDLPASSVVLSYLSPTTTPYYYSITDKMDETLLNNRDVVVKAVSNGTETDTLVLDTNYTIEESDHGFTISMDAGKLMNIITTHSADTLHIYFSAVLTEEALLASDSNDNKAILVYSNQLDADYPATVAPDGTIDGDDPFEYLFDDDANEEDGLGYYDDDVRDYTFQLDLSKVIADSNGEPLAGAVFALYDEGGAQLFLAPTEATTDGETYFIDKTGTASDTDGVITTTTENAANATFSIIGLDDATEYMIREVKAPTNYTKVPDFTVEITAGYDNLGALTSLSAMMNRTDALTVTAENVVEVTVENSADFILPSTGGMGTVVFQVMGGGMVLAAGLLLFIKRKNA